MIRFTAGEVEALLEQLQWMARLREAVSPGQPEPLVTAVAKLEDALHERGVGRDESPGSSPSG